MNPRRSGLLWAQKETAVAQEVMCVRSQVVVRLSSTGRLKPPKVTAFAKLGIGTAIQPSRERLRTVVDGCRWLRNIWRSQLQPPDPQSETGTLATDSGKMNFQMMSQKLARTKHILNKCYLVAFCFWITRPMATPKLQKNIFLVSAS